MEKTKNTRSGWDEYPAILARIKAPTFPDRDFSITQYGVVANNDATTQIQQAIDACHAAGGGRVVIPAGVYLSGALNLKSNVNLHLSAGATLRFVFQMEKYPPVLTRWEGIECLNHSPLIYAYEQENIAITGNGVLDGNATEETWWAWHLGSTNSRQRPAQRRLVELSQAGVPVEQRVFGEGHYLRPSFVQPYRCRNILIEGVTIRNAPMWTIHPVLCRNVTVRNVAVVSGGRNNDGCDPESCHDVLIENCRFSTGDDCIAIKSGRNDDGRRIAVASENIVIRNCEMLDGHGGVVIGSEISGGCRNVYIENCRMDSPQLDRALRFKNNAARGGHVENVFMRNVAIGRVNEAVLTIDFLYEEGAHGPHRPVVRNVQIDNVTASSSPRVMHVTGFAGAVIDQIRFRDCVFKGISEAEVVAHAGTIELHNVTLEPARKQKSLHSINATRDDYESA